MLVLVLKAVLTILCGAMFAYGLWSTRSGRVHCKGRWYERTGSPLGFWSSIALYLLGPPIIVYLAWTAR